MKSTRFYFGRALGLLCAVFFVSFGAISCSEDSETEYYAYDLQGTWVNQYESYTIDYAGGTFDSGSSSYAGDNLVVKFTGSDSGYIYIKYTRASCETHSDYSSYIYTYDTDAPDVGKWYAIAFKNLTNKSISISGAFNSSGVTSTATLEEAISTFTIDNGYFSFYSELAKK